MLRPIIFVNRRSEFADHNVGDQLCSPFLYFRHFYRGGYRAEILLRIRGRRDRMKYAVLRRIRDSAQAIVIGGGGLLGNRYFREGLQFWTGKKSGARMRVRVDCGEKSYYVCARYRI